jgi:hypothetical protein
MNGFFTEVKIKPLYSSQSDRVPRAQIHFCGQTYILLMLEDKHRSPSRMKALNLSKPESEMNLIRAFEIKKPGQYSRL